MTVPFEILLRCQQWFSPRELSVSIYSLQVDGYSAEVAGLIRKQFPFRRFN